MIFAYGIKDVNQQALIRLFWIIYLGGPSVVILLLLLSKFYALLKIHTEAVILLCGHCFQESA